MKLLKLNLLLLAVALSGCLLSCNSEEAGDVLSNETQNSEYALSDAEAKALIVSNFGDIATKSSETFELGERKSTRSYSISKEGGSAEIIPVYEYPVIKEDTEGYALVVADSRIPAVLAFVDYGSLADTLEIEPLNLYIKSIPELIAGFLEDYNSKSEEAVIQTRAVTSQRKNVELRDSANALNLDCSTPVWGQSSPYNANCPLVTSTACPDGVPSSWGGRYLTGCVPLATGEIIKYHIDKGWKSNIIQSQFGNSIAAFLVDIGTQVSVSYECTGSGVSASIVYNKVKSAFSHYGYTSGTWQSFDSWQVQSSLMSNYPVYIIGFTPYGPPDNGAGHAWIIDGQTVGDGLYYYFHMNWGWFGTSNGYFNCGNFTLPSVPLTTTNGHSFIFSTFDILTNIH
jgi:hypothetical protein